MRHIHYIYQNPLTLLRPVEYLYDRLEQLHLDRTTYRVGGKIYWKLTKAIDALRKKLSKLEKYNEPIRTKWEMLLDPFRRAQVLKELGGEAALERWEARRERFRIFGRAVRKPIAPEDRDVSDIYRRLSRPPGSGRVKTDRTGRFYLTPAIEPGDHDPSYVHPSGYNPEAETRPKPRIELFPEELRGEVLIGLGIRPNYPGSEFYKPDGVLVADESEHPFPRPVAWPINGEKGRLQTLANNDEDRDNTYNEGPD